MTYNRYFYCANNTNYSRNGLTSIEFVYNKKEQLIKMTALDGNYLNQNLIKERYENIKKPLNDKRLYRGLVLKNDMKVLLVSDPETDESAAALSINIGYLSDPDDLPGLAHFCEHVLFCGSEKYPNPTEYSTYLSQHGGGSNACTLMDQTNYYFGVTSDHLKEALDRFTQFFLKPLFNKDAMKSEISAIDLEHKKNLIEDSWRIEQIDRSSANPNHPYAKFGTGNKETLDTIPKEKGTSVRNALLKFHEDWYSANIMAVSVLGKENLDDLEKLVVKMFSEVANKEIDAPEWPEHPFNQDQFQHKWFIVPIKDARVLKLTFPLPDLRVHFRAGVEIYICHLLSHKADGSLISVLKKAGWSNSIVSGTSISVARGGCNFLHIVIDLTEKGIEHIDDLIQFFFQYLNMMRKAGPVEWLFKEYQQIAELNFNFRENLDPQNSVLSFVHGLQSYPVEEVLHAPCLPTEWRPDLINWVMDYLVPENIRIIIIAKAFENIATETETWYGTKYLKEKIPEDVISRWCNAGYNDEFKFPTKNEFIPTCFDIKANENSVIDKYPIIIKENSIMRIWFKQDNKYRTPKINLTLYFENPIVYLHPVDYNCAYLFLPLVEESLAEHSYKVNVAGLNCDLDANCYGFYLSLDGFNDKFHLVLEKIMDTLVNFTINPKTFEIFKEYYKRNLKNFETIQPSSQASYHLDTLLCDQFFTKTELLEVIDYLSVERLERFISDLFSKLHVEGLIYGNITESEALEMIQMVESKLTKGSTYAHETIIPLIPKHLLLHRQICLEQGCYFLYEVEHKFHDESCVTVYYQCGLQSTESNIHLELLEHIISQPCYDYLRVQEELCYSVFIELVRNNGVQGLKITVQSDNDPQFVEQKIDDFVGSMLDYLTNLSNEEFEQFKTSLAITRLEKPRTMNALFDSFLSEISIQQYNFDRDNIEVNYLKTVTKDQLIQFFKENIHQDSPISTKLVIRIVSATHKNTKPTKDQTKENELLSKDSIQRKRIIITDIEAFKASQALFPLLKPFKNIFITNKCQN